MIATFILLFVSIAAQNILDCGFAYCGTSSSLAITIGDAPASGSSGVFFLEIRTSNTALIRYSLNSTCEFTSIGTETCLDLSPIEFDSVSDLKSAIFINDHFDSLCLTKAEFTAQDMSQLTFDAVSSGITTTPQYDPVAKCVNIENDGISKCWNIAQSSGQCAGTCTNTPSCSILSSVYITIPDVALARTADPVYLYLYTLSNPSMFTKIDLTENCGLFDVRNVQVCQDISDYIDISTSSDLTRAVLDIETQDESCMRSVTITAMDGSAISHFAVELSSFPEFDGIGSCLKVGNDAGLVNPSCWNLLDANDLCPCIPGQQLIDGMGAVCDTCKVCSDCTAGTFDVSGVGEGPCSPCDVGKVSEAAVFTCSNCPFGTYNDLQSQQECKNCPQGRYGTESALTSESQCIACPRGSYSNATGATSDETCIECSPGLFGVPFLGTSSSHCIECEAGTFSDSSGASACADCIGGSYSPVGSVECFGCPQGKSSIAGTAASLSDCFDCPQGSFSVSGFTACQSCEIGTFQSSNGKSQCNECIAGRYAPTSGLSFCLNCSEGTISKAPKASTCSSCPLGTYSSTNGQSVCEICPSNSETLLFGATSVTFCACSEGFWGQAYANKPCTQCPAFSYTSCPLNSTLIQVQPGYFVQNPFDPNSIVACDPPEACVKTVDGVTTCASGYGGPICSECEPLKYYKLGSECKKCPQNSIWTVIMFIIGFLFFCLLLVKSAVAFERKSHSLGITVSWLQILALFSSLPVQWPGSVLSLWNAASLLNFNIELFAPECSTPLSFWVKWYIKLCFPFIFALTLGAMYFIHRFLRKQFPYFPSFMGTSIRDIINWMQTDDLSYIKNKDEHFPGRYVYAYTLVLVFCYTLLASTAVSPLKCTKQENGEWLMEQNIQIKCFEGFWLTGILPSVIIFGILYLAGIPLIFWLILRRFKNRTSEKEFLNKYGAIVLPYRKQYEYFELINMARRALIAVLIDFFIIFRTTHLQIFATLGITFLFLLVQHYIAPYKLPFNNSLSFAWISISIFCLFSGIVFENPNLREYEITFFATMVYAMFIGGCIYAVIVWIREIRFYGKHNPNTRTVPIDVQTDRNYLEKSKNRRSKLLTVFPRSYKVLSDHVALMNVKHQDSFYQDLSDLLDNLGNGLELYMNPLHELSKSRQPLSLSNISVEAGSQTHRQRSCSPICKVIEEDTDEQDISEDHSLSEEYTVETEGGAVEPESAEINEKDETAIE